MGRVATSPERSPTTRLPVRAPVATAHRSVRLPDAPRVVCSRAASVVDGRPCSTATPVVVAGPVSAGVVPTRGGRAATAANQRLRPLPSLSAGGGWEPTALTSATGRLPAPRRINGVSRATEAWTCRPQPTFSSRSQGARRRSTVPTGRPVLLQNRPPKEPPKTIPSPTAAVCDLGDGG